jgi:hypothetical protein
MMVWSIDKVLKRAGGAQALRDILRKHDQPVPKSSTISMWRARGSIAGQWSGAVVFALSCEGCDPLKLLADAPEPGTNDLFGDGPTPPAAEIEDPFGGTSAS